MVDNKIDSKRRIISIVIYIIMTSVLTQIDQITKYIAETNLYMKNDVDVIKNVLTFTYLRNDGSAFGSFIDSYYSCIDYICYYKDAVK